MTPPRHAPIVVTAGVDAVYVTYDEDDALIIPPAQARTLAAELLTNADRAENKLPADIYTVDRR